MKLYLKKKLFNNRNQRGQFVNVLMFAYNQEYIIIMPQCAHAQTKAYGSSFVCVCLSVTGLVAPCVQFKRWIVHKWIYSHVVLDLNLLDTKLYFLITVRFAYLKGSVG